MTSKNFGDIINKNFGKIIDIYKDTIRKKEDTKVDNIKDNEKHANTVSRKHIIAVASGKGGVGKTTVAANLGVALSKLGKKVTIVDMDLAMPNLEIITGLRNPPVGLIDVLEERLELDRVVYTGPMGTKIIPPGIMLEGYSKENSKEKIIRLLKSIDNDYVILDMPPGREAIDILWDDVEALLVINPDRAAILDAINMKTLLERKGIRILGAILNRSDHDLTLIDEIERVLETDIVAIIPESKAVKQAFNNEECIVVTEPDSTPSEELVELADEIIFKDEGYEIKNM